MNFRVGSKLWQALAVALLTISLPLTSAEMFKDPGSGTEFPTTVELVTESGNQSLELTGASVRKKFVFKVYSIAHYMQKPPSGSTQQVISSILSSDEPKQMTMKWLRKVSRDRIVNGYHDTLKEVLGNKSNGVQQSLDKFLAFYKTEATEGDTHVIRWLPGGKLELLINDSSQGELQDPELAKAFWMMWFGKKSVVTPAQLVSRIAD